MSFTTYLKEVFSTINRISKKTGYSRIALFLSFTCDWFIRRFTIDEFEFFQLYNSSSLQKSRFLSFRRCTKISDSLNERATKEDFDDFGEKHKFNFLFKDFIHREWLYIPDSTPEEIRHFLSKTDTFLAKASYSTQGNNIYHYRSSDLDPTAFIQEYEGKPFLLEAFIQQHPSLSTLNPTSVNTVRIVTARYKGQVMLVGACLRCGGKDAYVDNFHQGGVAYPLDLNTGTVTHLGKTHSGETYAIHPSTGAIMPGYQVPNWDILVDSVRKAAMISPNVAYAGWDIAITEDGVDFVEGNINYPDPVVIQLDTPDAYYRLKQFIKSVDKGVVLK